MRRYLFKKVKYVSLILALAMGSSAFASNTNNFSELKGLLEHRQVNQAYALAKSMRKKYAGNPAFDYLYGVAALRSGHPQDAAEAFDRILVVYPNDTQAHMGEAMAQVQLKNYDQAENEYKALLQLNPPVRARQSIQSFIARLEAAKTGEDLNSVSSKNPNNDLPEKPVLSAYLKLNAGYDSNVNTATAADFINFPTLGPFFFEISPASQQTGSLFGEAMGGVTGVYPVGENFAAFASVSASTRTNTDGHAYDNRIATALAGVIMKVHGYTIAVPVFTQLYDLHGQRFRNVVSFAPQITRPITKQLSLGAFIEHDRQFYPGSLVGTIRAQDTGMTMGGPLLGYQFLSVPISLSAKEFYGQEIPRQAGFPWVGRWFYGTENTLTWNKSEMTTPYATFRAQFSNYGGAMPGYIHNRRDTEVDVILGSRYAITKQFMFEPSYTLVRNFSNTSLFDFTRHQFMLNLTYLVSTAGK